MSGNVRLLAYAYIGICGAAILAGLWICIGLALSGGPNAGRALGTIGMPFLLLSIVYFIPGFVGGQGLLRGKSWARPVIIVLSALVLFAVPVGTLFGGWGLWVLWRRRREATPETPAPIAKPAAVSFHPLTADQKSRIGGILLAMVGVASLFVVMIGTGARLTHDTRVQVDGIVYYPAMIILVGLTAYGIRLWMRAPSTLFTGVGTGFANRRIFAAPREAEQIRARRLAELQADPVKRKYVERFERGESWTDDQIDYAENPARLETCEHLKPIERAIRDAGIESRYSGGLTLWAQCHVDQNALGERFVLPASVTYSEPHIYDRSLEDPPSAMIRCREHSSTIHVIHPSIDVPSTPWFPSTPA